MINRLNYKELEFSEGFENLISTEQSTVQTVEDTVRSIVKSVRLNGDEALLGFTNEFDRVEYKNACDLVVNPTDLRSASEKLDPIVKEALQVSIDRVRQYHLKQKAASGGGESWSFNDDEGNTLGQIVRSMEKVGVYVPGGKAAYPSSVIMTVIPAKVAGVGEIVLAVPAPNGILAPIILAAAYLCGVEKVYKIGGAQAIAAMAYGTDSVPRVDKIVGPGNIYVATAKKMVFGDVGIDMIAGPSEVVIVADQSTDPDWLAMDLFAQAEHDELAQSILISTNPKLLDEVENSMRKLLPEMQRAEIIKKSLEGRGALILVPDLNKAAELVNRIAPEHLQLALNEPKQFVSSIRHAGAIFVGRFSAEVVGDYTAGPSHVLPTSGTSRFASPLGVNDFQIRTSMIQCSQRGAIKLSRAAAIIAAEEGLEAHARSAEFRFRG
ncbi:MAG: histidinol dehydrogenase [Pseudomonadales bacterium]|nr:histidinol dehydrogenase [Pseudomonadales bacterium]